MMHSEAIKIFAVSNGFVVQLPASNPDPMQQLTDAIGPMISDIQSAMNKDELLAQAERNLREEQRQENIGKLNQDPFTFVFPTMREVLAFLTLRYDA